MRRAAHLSRTRSFVRSITGRAFLAVVLAFVMAWGSLTVADIMSPRKVSPAKPDSISLTAKTSKVAPADHGSRRLHRRCERLGEEDRDGRRARRRYPPRRRGPNCDDL
jgi:hypothetical protein